MFYAQLFTEQFTEELEIICAILGEDCETLTLIEYWTNFADIPSATCKCAPYYVFDQSSKTCLPIKNRLPHCVAGAELYGDFVFDLFL